MPTAGQASRSVPIHPALMKAVVHSLLENAPYFSHIYLLNRFESVLVHRAGIIYDQSACIQDTTLNIAKDKWYPTPQIKIVAGLLLDQPIDRRYSIPNFLQCESESVGPITLTSEARLSLHWPNGKPYPKDKKGSSPLLCISSTRVLRSLR